MQDDELDCKEEKYCSAKHICSIYVVNSEQPQMYKGEKPLWKLDSTSGLHKSKGVRKH